MRSETFGSGRVMVGAGRLTDAHRLIIASAATLFLELTLIRWIGENVVYVSYFTNFVLLASFLGIGLGFLAGHREQRWIKHLPYLLLTLFGLILVFPARLDRAIADVLLLGSGDTAGIPIWVLLPAVFVGSAAVMASMAQEVARLFARFEPLRAYRLDIGSEPLGLSTPLCSWGYSSWCGWPLRWRVDSAGGSPSVTSMGFCWSRWWSHGLFRLNGCSICRVSNDS